MIPERPVIAVSACLLGEKVRYDGGNKRNEILIGPLAAQFDYLPFCPEVGIGLPVPRQPMQLVETRYGVRMLGIADQRSDVTDKLHEYARGMAEQLANVGGVIFKCRSPSCGLSSTPLYNRDGEVIATTSGVFAREIVHLLPDLPLAEDEALADPQRRNDFIRRVTARYDAGL
jgi:uncharacterized protein YbbK (DUF523 family)